MDRIKAESVDNPMFVQVLLFVDDCHWNVNPFTDVVPLITESLKLTPGQGAGVDETVVPPTRFEVHGVPGKILIK